MTGLPAERMKLAGRGVLKEGNFADILVFDPQKFTDHATFQDPAQMADGLDYLFLNGKLTIEKDQWVGEAHNGVLLTAE